MKYQQVDYEWYDSKRVIYEGSFKRQKSKHRIVRIAWKIPRFKVGFSIGKGSEDKKSVITIYNEVNMLKYTIVPLAIPINVTTFAILKMM